MAPVIGNSFVDIHQTSKRLGDCMVRIGSLSYSRDDTGNVLRRLRFLVLAPQDPSSVPETECSIDIAETNPLQYLPPGYLPNSFDSYTLSESRTPTQARDCQCRHFPAFSPNQLPSSGSHICRPTLRVTYPGEVSDCTHFLAVSYAWEQPVDVGNYYDGSSKYRIITEAGIRQSRTPVNILDRAIEYAAERNFRFIWIDQECIEQDNPSDKETYVQAMDEIYRSARQVVAVLNSPILTQAEVSVFESQGLVSARLSQLSEEGREASQIMFGVQKKLSADPWFSRAWTLQESLVAATSLHLLLPCETGTQSPGWMGMMSSQLVLDLWFLKQFKGFRRSGVEIDFLICPEYQEPDFDNSREDKSVHRLGCMDAYGLLHDRRLSIKSDIVAIIANICRYQFRLDGQALKSGSFDLDTAIYTQALLNGDLSCYFASYSKRLTQEIRPGDRLLQEKPYSWCHIFNRTLLELYDTVTSSRNRKDSVHREFNPLQGCRITPPILQPTGLLCEGYLFYFHTVDFGDFDDCGTEFLGLNSYLKGHEFDLEKLQRALISIITALTATGLRSPARAVLRAAMLCGIPMQLTGTSNVQKDLDTITPSVPSCMTISPHPSRSRGSVITVSGHHQPCQQQLMALHVLYLVLTSVMHKSAWMVAVSPEPCFNTDSQFAFIFASVDGWMTAEKGEDTVIFVPRRVLIHSETLKGEAERLPFWQVEPQASVDNVPRLKCEKLSNIWSSEHWDEPFLCGDWSLLSRTNGASYLLI